MRFVLTWETDANDVEFPSTPRSTATPTTRPSSCRRAASSTRRHTATARVLHDPRPRPRRPTMLSIHYYSRGRMGYGMGSSRSSARRQGQAHRREAPVRVMNDGRTWISAGRVVGLTTSGPVQDDRRVLPMAMRASRWGGIEAHRARRLRAPPRIDITRSSGGARLDPSVGQRRRRARDELLGGCCGCSGGEHGAAVGPCLLDPREDRSVSRQDRAAAEAVAHRRGGGCRCAEQDGDGSDRAPEPRVLRSWNRNSWMRVRTRGAVRDPAHHERGRGARTRLLAVGHGQDGAQILGLCEDRIVDAGVVSSRRLARLHEGVT